MSALLKFHEARKERSARFERAAYVAPAPSAPAEIIPWEQRQLARFPKVISGKPDWLRVQEIVAAHFGITREGLLCSSRKAYLVLPRHVAAYLTRKMFPQYSLVAIGAYLGRRDHSVIVNSINRVESMLDGDPDFQRELDGLTAKVMA